MQAPKVIMQVGIWKLVLQHGQYHIEGLDKRTGIEHIYCFVRVERGSLYSPYAHNILISKEARNKFTAYFAK